MYLAYIKLNNMGHEYTVVNYFVRESYMKLLKILSHFCYLKYLYNIKERDSVK